MPGKQVGLSRRLLAGAFDRGDCPTSISMPRTIHPRARSPSAVRPRRWSAISRRASPMPDSIAGSIDLKASLDRYRRLNAEADRRAQRDSPNSFSRRLPRSISRRRSRSGAASAATRIDKLGRRDPRTRIHAHPARAARCRRAAWRTRSASRRCRRSPRRRIGLLNARAGRRRPWSKARRPTLRRCADEAAERHSS